MANYYFDTLEYAKHAQTIGFTVEQAEFQAKEFARIARNFNKFDEEVVTKQELKKELTAFEEHLTNKLTIRFGGMLIAAVSVLATLITVLHH